MITTHDLVDSVYLNLKYIKKAYFEGSVITFTEKSYSAHLYR